MAIKGAFTAGLISGFASSLEKGIDERKKRMQELIDQQMDTAKRAAPKYAETKAQLSQISEIGDAFKRDFNISDEEFLALTQTADVTSLYTSVYKEHLNRQQNGLGGVSGDEILKMVKLPEGFAMPKGETRDSMLEKMFGLRTAALKDEADPKSEGAQNRSFVKSLKDFMVIDPSMTAEQRLANMKVMGMDVNTLLDFDVLGGSKRDVIQGVTRESETGVTPIDYKDTDAKATQTNFYRMMTIRTTGTDFSNEFALSNYTSANPDNAKVVQKSALNASLSMAELERQIIRIGMGNPAVSGRAGRFDIMNTIAQSVDNIDELDSLRNSIANGNAITIIQDAIKNNRMLTEEDVDAIITNAQKQDKTDEPAPTDNLESTAPADKPSTAPDKPKDESEMTFAERQAASLAAATPEAGQEAEAPTVETPAEQAPDTTMDTVAQVALDILGTMAPKEVDKFTPDQLNEMAQKTIKGFQEAAKEVTYDQYKGMTLEEKKAAGLPTRGIEAAYAFGIFNPKSYFKGATETPDTTAGSVSEIALDILGTMAPKEVDKFTPDQLNEMAQKTIEEFQGVAKNYTYEQYKGMTRKEKQAAGLPTKDVQAAYAFGVVNPQSYFKGGADKLAPEGFDAATSDIETVSKVVTDVFSAMVDEFPDLNALEDTDIQEFLKQNNVPFNDNLVKMLKLAIQKYSE
jgi:hypothetical protein